MDEAIKEFIKYLGALIFVIGAQWLRDKATERQKKKEAAQVANARAELSDVDFINLQHEKIKNYENELMKVYRPSRMFVMYRYNGEFTEAKISLQKIIIRHEIVLHSGVRYMAQHFRGDPCPEMLYNTFKELSDRGHYSIKKREDDNPPFNTWQETWRFDGCLFIDLAAGSAKLSAILVMQWPGENPLHDNDIRDIISSDAVLKIEKTYRAKTLAELKNGGGHYSRF